MKLKVGKIYENRQGDLVKIIFNENKPTSNYSHVGVFYDGKRNKSVTETFKEGGFYIFMMYKHRYDLIEEIGPKEIEIL